MAGFYVIIFIEYHQFLKIDDKDELGVDHLSFSRTLPFLDDRL